MYFPSLALVVPLLLANLGIMRDFHPADTRHRANRAKSPARSAHLFIDDRQRNTPLISNPRADRRAMNAASKTAHQDVMTSAKWWVNLIPFGAQWVGLRAEHARNAAKGHSSLYTVAQIIGAMLLYWVITSMAGSGVVRL